ncbi:MAG: head-tail connector protein [Hyphomicrobium sp.]|nr:head-tail connector protein [Hyphomicrobium sp.]
MALVLTSGPALEPVTVSEAKAHLRVDGTAEDTLIASLILTSRLHIETALGLALITQSWRLLLDAWPDGKHVELPLRPLQAVDEVRVVSAAGDPTIVSASNYLVDVAGVPPRLVRNGAAWPQPGRQASGIGIDFAAGYGDAAADVPAPVRQALLLLVAHWHEHRDPIEIGAADMVVPAAVSDLLAPYRMARL